MKRGRESGLSDAIGAIVLVAVVGMGIGLIGMFILSQPGPEKIPALSSDITTIGRTILITHNGGDTMGKDEMAIIVDGEDLKDSFQNIDGSPWSSWAVGDSLLYRVPDGLAMPEGVTIFYIGGSSTRIIQSMGVPQSVSAGGLYPTGTITPTPTTTTAPGAPVVADFGASPTTGLVPLSVQFADASTGPVSSWAWTFGDAGTSTDENPLHQYASTGTYSVSLTVSNGTGTDAITKTDYIEVTAYAPGLLANYYNDQAWSVPAVTKVADRIRYADTESGYASDVLNWPMDYIADTDDFSVSFDGYLLITTEDDYTFYLTSDDGSYLSLDGSQIIDNGGLHSPREYTTTVHLTPGYHPVQVRMYENTGGAVVYLEYSTPTVARTFVTDLFHMPNTPPFSDFSATPRVGNAPLSVQFTDTSVDASSWEWNFGDGSPLSNAKDPQHTYSSGGSYTVSLTTTNAIGSNTATKMDYIVIGTLDPGLTASYYSDQTWTTLAGTRTDTRIWFADAVGVSSGYATDEVNWPTSMIGEMDDFSVSWDGFLSVPTAETYTFYLTSDDGSWLWIDDVMIIDNGGLHAPTELSGAVALSDGYHSIRVRMFENTGNAVAHLEYSTPTVARTVVTDYWHVPATPVTPAPVAGFTGTPVSGNAPLTVVFTDSSTGVPTSWLWDFGDGDATNVTLQNPVHTYAGAGTYTVTLTASNTGGSDSETRTNYITVSPTAPAADFIGTPTNGTAPLTVTFTDASTNTPTSWAWVFGDGDTTNTTVQNPVHTYASAGTYTVTLTATNAGGSDPETKTNYITVSLPPAPVADFTGSPTSGTRPLKVIFTDTSTNTPTSWAWVFGDGDTTNSTVQNPVHTYASAGTYTVTLTATNAGGSDPETKTNYITASLPPRTTIFYDGFETSRPSGNGWTETGSVDWGTAYPRIGTYSIRMRGGATAETISRTVSTAGYSQIIVSVYLGADSLDSSSEYVEAEYSTDGGGSWTQFGAILNGDAWEDGQLHSFTSGELPAGADDNPNFQIRLRTVGNSHANDRGYFDEVLVTGIPD